VKLREVLIISEKRGVGGARATYRRLLLLNPDWYTTTIAFYMRLCEEVNRQDIANLRRRRLARSCWFEKRPLAPRLAHAGPRSLSTALLQIVTHLRQMAHTALIQGDFALTLQTLPKCIDARASMF